MDRQLRLVKQAWGLYRMREASHRTGPNDHTKRLMIEAAYAMELTINESLRMANKQSTAKA